MNDLPSVSIVIPSLNAENTIKDCLDSIKQLNYPYSKVEVIVVDNGSTDRTVELAMQFGAMVLHRPDLNVGGLRNAGAEVSNGDILAFTDSDCIVPMQWLIKAVEILNDESVGAVGGVCLLPENSLWIEKAWVCPQKYPIIRSRYLPACDFILKKNIFDRLGGFNEDISSGEDDDLSIRLRKEGYILILHKLCNVIHLGYPKTLTNVAKRQIWHGKNMLEHKESVFDKMFIFTHINAISLLILPFAIIFIPISKIPLFITLSCLIAVASISAAHKTSKCIGDNQSLSPLVRFIYLFPIFIFFFFGRSVGLFYNYKNIIMKRLKSIVY